MDTLKIGNYIQFFSKTKRIIPKRFGRKVKYFISSCIQVGNRWNTLDISILLDLADILDTTVDKILSGGNILLRKSKKIKIADIKEGFNALEDLKVFFGENSPFYRGAIEGINLKMNIDIEEYLKDEYTKEVLLAEAIIHYLMNGYIIDQEEIAKEIRTDYLKNMIRKYLK